MECEEGAEIETCCISASDSTCTMVTGVVEVPHETRQVGLKRSAGSSGEVENDTCFGGKRRDVIGCCLKVSNVSGPPPFSSLFERLLVKVMDEEDGDRGVDAEVEGVLSGGRQGGCHGGGGEDSR